MQNSKCKTTLTDTQSFMPANRQSFSQVQQSLYNSKQLMGKAMAGI